jgi:Na+/H+-dicarboxylate symporter
VVLYLVVALFVGVVLGLAASRRGGLGEASRRLLRWLLAASVWATLFSVGARSEPPSHRDVWAMLLYAAASGLAGVAAAWLVFRAYRAGPGER